MAVAAFLASCGGKWSPAPPASSEAINSLVRASGLTLPSDYLEFLTRCNGGNGFLAVQPRYLRVWPAEEVMDMNRDYNMPEYVAGFFGFGDAGGHEFLAFDTRGPQPWPVVAIPFIPMDIAEAWAVAGSFSELLNYVVSPQQKDAEPSAAPDRPRE